jgi:hypothetical protein
MGINLTSYFMFLMEFRPVKTDLFCTFSRLLWLRGRQIEIHKNKTIILKIKTLKDPKMRLKNTGINLKSMLMKNLDKMDKKRMKNLAWLQLLKHSRKLF